MVTENQGQGMKGLGPLYSQEDGHPHNELKIHSFVQDTNTEGLKPDNVTREKRNFHIYTYQVRRLGHELK